MGFSSSIGEAAGKIRRLNDDLPELALRASRKVARYGKTLFVEEARDLFGADRRPSQWKRGRKTVNARYVVKRRAGTIEGWIYPTGDPYYVFAHGRPGGTKIVAKRTAANGQRVLATPFGPRTTVRLGALPARRVLIDRPQRLFRARVPELYRAEESAALRKIFR